MSGTIGAIAGAVGALGNLANTAISQNLGLSKSQKQQNQFNADQAQIQRDWQEQMYKQYSSIEGQVSQMQEAGINPASAYGSLGSGGVGSGASASGSSPSANRIDKSTVVNDAVQAIGAQQMMKNNEVERALKQSQIAVNNAQADSIVNNNSVFGERWNIEREIGTARIDNITADTLVKRSAESLNRAHISQSEAQTALIQANTALANVDAEFRQQYLECSIALMQAQERYQSVDADYLGARRAVELGRSRFEFRQAQRMAELQIEIQNQTLRNLVSEGKLTEEQYRNLTAKTTREVVGIISDVGSSRNLMGRGLASINPEVGDFFNVLAEKYGVPDVHFKGTKDPREKASQMFWDMVLNPEKRRIGFISNVYKFHKKF